MSRQKSEEMSSAKNESFFDTTEEAEFSLSPDSGVHDIAQMTPEEKAIAVDQLTQELAKTEEEINTLRQVLSSKIRRQQELKRKLGITVWKEFREDMEQGIRNIQESTAYQVTSQTLKTASEKTTEALSGIGASVSKKIDEVKQSNTYKSIEEKVGSAYTNVKTKVRGPSMSESDSTGLMGEPLVDQSNGSKIPAEKH